ERVSQLRQQHSGLTSRIEVLQGLIKSHEGLGTGVREVLGLLEQPEPGAWSSVMGIIADFLTVRREHAPLIDLALGDWTQRFLVRDVPALMVALEERGQPFAGRVSFSPSAATHVNEHDTNGQGTDGQADHDRSGNGSYSRPHAQTLLRL